MNRTQRCGNNWSHSQDRHYQLYCPECRSTNFAAHKKGCVYNKKLKISATARFPKKNASKKIWQNFNNKFCRREILSTPILNGNELLRTTNR